MSRPRKYKTEAERLQARREQTRKAVNKHRKGVSNNVSTNSMVESNVSNNVSYNNNNNNNSVSNNNNNNNNSNKNYKLLYELLKREHEQLIEENRVTNEYCKELEEQLNEAKEMGY